MNQSGWFDIDDHGLRVMGRATFILTGLLIAIQISHVTTGEEQTPSVIITEISVASNSTYDNLIDWNGDGEVDHSSDQFIEIYNALEIPVDLSGWWIDDGIETGSPPCSIEFGTTIQPGAYMVFYRAQTGIELDLFEGDTATLSDSFRSQISSRGLPSQGHGNSSSNGPLGSSFGISSNGSWISLSVAPTPGSPNDQPWIGTNHTKGTCSNEHIPLPETLPTYGPIGATVAHPVQMDKGVHLEICNSEALIFESENIPQIPEGSQLVCGAIYQKTTFGFGCLETESGNFCEIGVSDAITVPGKICSDQNTPEGVMCRDAWAFHENPLDPLEPPAAEYSSTGGEVSSTIYWIGVASLIGLASSSLTALLSNWRRNR